MAKLKQQDDVLAWPKDEPFFVVKEFRGQPFLLFGFEQPEYARKWGEERVDLINTLNRHEGYHKVARASRVYDVAMLSKHANHIYSELEELSTANASAALEALKGVIDPFIAAQRARMEDSLARGLIQYEDLHLLFQDGDEVIADYDGEKLGGIFKTSSYEESMFGAYFSAQIEVIHNLGQGVQLGKKPLAVGSFEGYGVLADLPLRKITPEEKEALSQRGTVYREVVTTASYVQYTGHLRRSSWWSEKNYRANGRVMIDAPTFRQSDNDQWSSESRSARIEYDDDNDNAQKVKTTIADSDLWRTLPFVYGFSFAAKQWGRMAVSGLKPINWRTDAWGKLVLDPRYKEIVKALVEHAGEGSFSDLIDGKGGGTIFMLDGPPGQGKTLTAETVAEELQRPLYSISVGELGTDPDTLEQRLREILDIAVVWNAVLLLDEADIFLEARNESDIVRNAMVGVFLRLLEYHQGVLFLTTNRVRNIDEAFLSRISVSIHFEEADHDKRVQVWTNLLIAAKLYVAEPSGPLSSDEVEVLAHFPLNGRQIKNVIRQAQTLGKSRGWAVDLRLLREVIDISQPRTAHTLGQGLKRSLGQRVKEAWGALFG